MIVPLYATVVNNGKALEIWADKQKHVVQLPISPYFYSKKPRNGLPAQQSQEIVRFVSDFKEHLAWKYSFDSVKEIPVYRDDDSMEADIPYIQRACIDTPQYFLQYPQTQKPDIMYLDIEVRSIGRFPQPQTDKIIGIGFMFNDEEPVILTINNDEEDDSKILEKFSDELERLDPDIIVTYFGNSFDVPYIIERLNLCEYSSKAFTRDERADECYFLDNEKTKHIYIKGRVMFDLFDEVVIDQTLSGISSRKMKDVAKWYGVQRIIQQKKGYENYEIIVEDLSNTAQLIGTNKLHDYLLSDVLITRALSDIYINNVTQLADIMKVPLNIIAKRSASMLGTIFYARELKNLNVISDNAIYQRHKEVFGTPVMIKKRGRMVNEFKGGSGYQGALVELNKEFEKKLIKPLKKIDFQGLYPSIMINFNLSVETVTLKELKDFSEAIFDIRMHQNSYELEFSDARLNKNVVLTIGRQEGFIPRNLKIFIAERAKIKSELKTCNDQDKRIELNSKSWVYKVLGNACGYGVNGTGFFRYGNLWCAVATTAIGRFLIRFVKDKLQGTHVEIDTDGIYFFAHNISAETLTAELNSFMQQKFGLTTKFIIEQDDYVSGFFARMKNYALLDDKNRLIKHGVAMKASSKNLLTQGALNKILMAILKEENVERAAIDSYDKIDQAELYEFLQSSRIGMELEMYASQNILQVRIGKQSESFHEKKIVAGDVISYAKTHSEYIIREKLKDSTMIDKTYYRKQILAVVKRLGLTDIEWKLKNRNQTMLNQF